MDDCANVIGSVRLVARPPSRDGDAGGKARGVGHRARGDDVTVVFAPPSTANRHRSKWRMRPRLTRPTTIVRLSGFAPSHRDSCGDIDLVRTDRPTWCGSLPGRTVPDLSRARTQIRPGDRRRLRCAAGTAGLPRG